MVFILAEEIVTLATRKNVQMVKQVLNKNTMDRANNSISFLNNLTEEEIKKENIQDRGLVITWVRKVVNKHRHLKMVEAKWNFMHSYVKEFVLLFTLHYSKGGFPSSGKRMDQCFPRKNIMTG